MSSYGYVEAAVAAPIAARLCDSLRSAGHVVRYEGHHSGIVELSGGLKLSYMTMRERLVETFLMDSETKCTYNEAWGYADVVLLDAPTEDAGFDALVAEIERVRQLLTLAEPQPKTV